MEYFLITLSVICIGFTLMFDKLYQKSVVTDSRQLFLYPIFKALLLIPLFVALNGFSLEIKAFGIFMAGAYALFVSGYTMIGMVAVKYGKFCIYSMFLMVGGMIFPYLYGVLFLRETLTVARIVGICLLIIALVFNAVRTKEVRKEKTTWLFWVLCSVVFVLNGFVGISSKAHQISIHAISTFAFITWNGVFQLLFSSIGLTVACFITTKKDFVKTPILQRNKIKRGLWISVCVVLLTGINTVSSLTAAKTLPAVVQYPFITGGVTIITTLIARIVYKEKISRPTACSLATLLIGTVLFVF